MDDGVIIFIFAKLSVSGGKICTVMTFGRRRLLSKVI
jgi:hypothetical protein